MKESWNKKEYKCKILILKILTTTIVYIHFLLTSTVNGEDNYFML